MNLLIRWIKDLTSEEKLTIFQQLLEDSPDFVQIVMDKIKKTEDEKLSQSKSNGSSPLPCGTPNQPELVRGNCTVTNDQNSLQGKSNEKHSFVYPGSQPDFRDRVNYPGNREFINSLERALRRHAP